MSLVQRHANFTAEEYLAIERISPIKHEYLQGQLIAMAGASKAHVIIVGNLLTLLVSHLRGSGYLVYANDMKVRLPELNIFYYADIAVTCDQQDRDSSEDFILHPKLIVEVLSDSTEAFDRGEKFAHYQTIPDLEEYILIHQKQALIEYFERKSNNLWVPQVFRGGDTFELKSIGFLGLVSALYENTNLLI